MPEPDATNLPASTRRALSRAHARHALELALRGANWTTAVIGTTPEYFSIRAWKSVRGRELGQDGVDIASKTIVLGQTVSDRLFGPGVNAVDQTVRVRSMPFQVVGVLQHKGQSPVGSDYDDTALVPVSTFQSKIQGGLQKYIPGAILVSATSVDDTAPPNARSSPSCASDTT